MGILYMELGEFARVRVRIFMKIPESRVDSGINYCKENLTSGIPRLQLRRRQSYRPWGTQVNEASIDFAFPQ